MVEQWNSDGGTAWWNGGRVMVEECWWKSGTVMVEQWNSVGRAVWWNSVVEECRGRVWWNSGTVAVEQWNTDGGTVLVEQ